MRNAKGMILLAAAAGGLAGCHTAPPTVSENVMACGRIADTAERYRCYDSLNTSMRPTAAANASAASAGSTTSATARGSTATARAAPPAPAAAPPAVASTKSRAHEAPPAPRLQANAPSVAPSVCS